LELQQIPNQRARSTRGLLPIRRKAHGI
jgi:hypothetical protein